MALITCQNVKVGYEGRVVAENINFSVEKGDYLFIIGENGSGKSTLMKTLLGLRSVMEGAVLTGDGLKQNEIGYLPQQTMLQRDFPASVREIVLSGCLNRRGFRPFYNKNEKKRAEEMMEKLSILDLQNRCYRELSGGQMQRVLLARALCATEQLLLLDEPVAGLDPKAASEMYELVAKLNKKYGLTVIMVSHDLEAAVRYASKILHVSQEPLYFGTKKGYLSSETGKRFLKEGGE